LYAYLWTRFGPTWNLILFAFVCSFFILIAVVDLKYRLVLNVMVYPAIAMALLRSFILPDLTLLSAVIGGAFGLVIFLAAALLRPGDLGGGDVKLAALIGLTFGFPYALWALMVGIFAGGIAAVALLLTRRWGPKSHIPYAPFLCLGALIALFYNPISLIFRF
jgi:leader peptidase (prepilin peptidase)/N-methyltransferase